MRMLGCVMLVCLMAAAMGCRSRPAARSTASVADQRTPATASHPRDPQQLAARKSTMADAAEDAAEVLFGGGTARPVKSGLRLVAADDNDTSSSAGSTTSGRSEPGQDPAESREPMAGSGDETASAPDVLAEDGSAAELPEALPVSLDAVLQSVYGHYPMLRSALEMQRIAEGRLLEASGEFDLKVKGGGTTQPLGFYQNHRFGAGVEQPLFGGGEFYGGYRIGRGLFPAWYGERATDEGGEFKAGFQIPLLRNRAIDERRAAVYRAALGRDSAEPAVLLELIGYIRAASHAYWDWVAAGQGVRIERALLEIAESRQQGLMRRVAAGDLPRITLVDNQRLVVSRRASLIDAVRKLRQSSIKLSLFLRTPTGQPVRAAEDQLPDDFPGLQPYDESQLEADIESALVARPETQLLSFLRQQLDVDLRQARNLYLPEVSFGSTVSKDVGAPASSKRDKTPLELEASLLVTVPLQRRKALGKLQATEGKLAQLHFKTRFAQEKIAVEVRNAAAALVAALERATQATETVDLSLQMEDAERKKFASGSSDLLLVNLREKATADARKSLVAAKLEYFRAEADYRAALAAIPIPDDN